ncbi:MAG TPA: competence/damage-inducible protein A [Ignavibacteria bacterium]|nr:competence/damage-inducible protein A [Ignavibacteria bacterium]HQY52262.1 competence/damage-inducible protein A [Ignavibacteria bacterium]HRB01067.1 competence/damage-inducible protein A [Ignavibacteria bacterium]
MKAKLISIGDEILIGQIINTNAAFIGERFYSAGIPVLKNTVIGDEENILMEELSDSEMNYDVTIITGGLGPTHDDITKPVLVKYFNDKLISDTKVLEHVRNIFLSRNINMPLVNEAQALIPSNSKVIWNSNGTAPGILIVKDKKVFVALPGVPYEMKPMIDEQVIPFLIKFFDLNNKLIHRQKTLLTTGMGESSLNELLGNISELIGESKLAFLPSSSGVRLRINVTEENESEAEDKLFLIENKIRDKIGEFIFGEGEIDLENVIGQILKERNLKLALAESCTGGRISSRIVSVPGSSEYYLGGVCTYSNEMKISILGVNEDTLNKFGAVSKETATELAECVRKITDADYAISTTGIAGPTGGTEEKPVGLVWIGFADRKSSYAQKFLFGNNREINIQRSSQRALDILRRELLGIKTEY